MLTQCPDQQRGAASLLVALVLMTAVTLITLAVARTELAEARIVGNQHWHARLATVAESGWQRATAVVTGASATLTWQPEPGTDALLSRTTPTPTVAGVETTLLYRRADNTSPLIDIQATSAQPGATGLAARVRQTVRLLTVLSPLAETAPPLVINGCLTTTEAMDIRPIDSDRADAGDAVWQFHRGRCRFPARVDRHGGGDVEKALEGELWSTIFSVDRDAYARLAAAERSLAPDQRRYWLVDPAPGSAPRWDLSLGSAGRPVVLVFPAAVGCPRFTAGVRIFGIVFIDAACDTPLATSTLEIIGSLVVNGAVNAAHAHVQLSHIQVADHTRRQLALPVLRAVRIPGSWRDF